MLSLLMIVSLIMVTVLVCPVKTEALAKKYSNFGFLDEEGIERSRRFEHIQSNYKNLRSKGETWGHYVVVGTVKIDDNLTVDGEVFLLLANDSKLIINAEKDKAGINVASGNKLNIYQQKTSTGQKLGELQVSGGKSSAGIGSGSGEIPGQIEINGGKITAIGGLDGAGIGSGYGKHGGGTIIIRGGEIEASCWLSTSGEPNSSGAGIGGGCYGDGGIITINGGKVTAKSFSGAAIGGGREGTGGSTISITGGDITAVCKSSAAAIGGGDSGNSGNINISGGDVKAESRGEAAIGAGKDGYCRTIDISGGKIRATSAITGNGIGGSKTGMGGTVSISGGTVIVGAGTYNKYDQVKDIGVGKDNKLDSLEVSGDAVLLLKNNRYNDPIATTSHTFETVSSPSGYEKYNLPLSSSDKVYLDLWCSNYKLAIWSPAVQGTKIVTDVSLASAPDKIDYYSGDELDLTGGQLFVKTIHNQRNFKVAMTDPRVSHSGFNSHPDSYGEQEIEVSFLTYKTKISVKVSPLPDEPLPDDPLLDDPLSDSPFSDVPLDHEFYKAIMDLVDKGITKGYEDGRFGENDPITRAQIAVMLVRARPDLKPDGMKSEFTDVPAGYWAEGAIAAAHEAGILDGYGGGRFGPDDNVTRAQLAKMVANAFNIKVDPSNLVSFTDVPPSYWAEEFISALASNKIVGGYGAGFFRPDYQATRGQFAKYLSNILSLVEK